MPMTAKIVRLMHITIALSVLGNIMLIGLLAGSLRVTPSEVLLEVRSVKSEVRTTNETFRTSISNNQDEIKQLKADMQLRDEQLKRANERLLKLDPDYKFEPNRDKDN